MQSAKLPSACCSSIEKIVRKFIWGYNEDHRGISLVKWKELCQPIHNGRVCLLDLASQNKAFLSKLAFKLVAEPDLLRVRVLKGKYEIRGLVPTLKHKPKSSRLWKNITGVWDDTMLHVKWNPGNGKQVKFWRDYWIGDLGPLNLLSYADIDPLV